MPFFWWTNQMISLSMYIPILVFKDNHLSLAVGYKISWNLVVLILSLSLLFIISASRVILFITFLSWLQVNSLGIWYTFDVASPVPLLISELGKGSVHLVGCHFCPRHPRLLGRWHLSPCPSIICCSWRWGKLPPLFPSTVFSPSALPRLIYQEYSETRLLLHMADHQNASSPYGRRYIGFHLYLSSVGTMHVSSYLAYPVLDHQMVCRLI